VSNFASSWVVREPSPLLDLCRPAVARLQSKPRRMHLSHEPPVGRRIHLHLDFEQSMQACPYGDASVNSELGILWRTGGVLSVN